MRLGVFGGTFDPIHYGHLLLAESCRQQCALDQVWFIPAAVSPHKTAQTHTPAADRLEMVRLATGGNEPFVVSDLEIRRGGVSYTVETLESLLAEDASRELFLLLGADSLVDLPNWRDPRRVCELAWPIFVGRLGTVAELEILRPLMAPQRFEGLTKLYASMPTIGLSSTEIRRAVRAGSSIRYQTPRAVEEYIRTHGLYQAE